ncbi:phospholipase D-like domain-containing protein [Cupriavidus necator]|nr:phospholipase D-like domain-containing protein [Cupriavidus necator]MDX6008524.1 phospholipase D-like domain-containing protein [Cupriavidus necator]
MIELIINESKHNNHLTRVGQLLEAASNVVIVSGWLKKEGVDVLKSALLAAVGRGATVTVYSNKGDRAEETEQVAIQRLTELGVSHVLVRDFYLHSKIYYFEQGDRYTALIGSANLTRGALCSNEELSVEVSGNLGDTQHTQIFAYLARVKARIPAKASVLARVAG